MHVPSPFPYTPYHSRARTDVLTHGHVNESCACRGITIATVHCLNSVLHKGGPVDDLSAQRGIRFEIGPESNVKIHFMCQEQISRKDKFQAPRSMEVRENEALKSVCNAASNSTSDLKIGLGLGQWSYKCQQVHSLLAFGNCSFASDMLATKWLTWQWLKNKNIALVATSSHESRLSKLVSYSDSH